MVVVLIFSGSSGSGGRNSKGNINCITKYSPNITRRCREDDDRLSERKESFRPGDL